MTESASSGVLPRKPYPSDLTDAEWAHIEPFVRVNEESLGPQDVIYLRRDIVDAILYRTRTGCQWRYLPHDFPKWESVYKYFRLWVKKGVWQRINDTLRRELRVKEERTREPTAAILDSQSVKTAEEADERGFDAGKKVKGRKRHLLVDTLGLILMVCISTADVQDRDAAAFLLPHAARAYPTLKKVWADAGYQGPRVQRAAKAAKLDVEIVKRPKGVKGFVLLSRRWVVERTNAWISRDRALAKDYERTPESAEALIHISMVRKMARRLAA